LHVFPKFLKFSSIHIFNNKIPSTGKNPIEGIKQLQKRL